MPCHDPVPERLSQFGYDTKLSKLGASSMEPWGNEDRTRLCKRCAEEIPVRGIATLDRCASRHLWCHGIGNQKAGAFLNGWWQYC
jgi:hypothetical protein